MSITTDRIKFLLYSVFNRNVEKKAEWIRKHRVFKEFGENNRFALFMIPADAKCISFHNNISVSTGATFICHDTINSLINHLDGSENKKKLKNEYKPIEIFDNVFIGANVTFCPGVKVGPNVIVAAGAVVTKDIPEGTIVGGVPAKVIGSFDDMVQRRRSMETSKKD